MEFTGYVVASRFVFLLNNQMNPRIRSMNEFVVLDIVTLLELIT